MSRRNNIIGSLLNPLALSPALWIDFSDASTITLNGSTIAQVNDKSGNARHFTQGTASSQPLYVTNVQNGRSVARFDGTNDYLGLGSSDLARNVSGVTIYLVRMWSASPTTTRSSFTVSNGSSGGQIRAGIYAGLTSGKAGVGGRRLDANSFQGIDSTNNVSTVLFQMNTGVLDYATAAASLYINDVLETSTGSFQTAGSTSNTAALNSAIGANGNGASQYFQGDIGEILVYHAAHSASQRQDVWNYLRLKWAI